MKRIWAAALALCMTMGATALAEGTFRVGVKQDVYGFGYYDEATGEFSGMEVDLGEKLAEALGVGEPTLNDIVAELCKPGRDVRDSLPKPLLRSDVMGLDDLKPGMELTGTVRNVIDFGAFVDIGVHQDGLVHISRMADRFIRHPSEVVRVGDVVTVWVVDVDVKKQRIALSMVKGRA